MAGKARVHELAKELGVTSKEVLARLNEQGEFVKSASSTVEAPVARRLRESFGGSKPAPDKGAGQGRRQIRQPGPGEIARQGSRQRDPQGRRQRRGDRRAGEDRQRRGGHSLPRPPPRLPAGAHAGARRPAPPPPGPPRDSRPPSRRPRWSSRCDSRPASRAADAQAGDASPARRQQPVLVDAIGRPAHSAPTPAGSAPRAGQARGAPSGRFARQHAAPSRRRCRRARPPGPHRRAATRRRPARRARRPLRRRRR